ncbi:hypothetical protein ACOI1C_09610 [Bacillus sp. DJP31]|uniref:hypothetical protein n=1 Tax=Bacillus sp. DJP31 TaxID=3409789 RepID=UPI003BB72BAB
MKKNFLYFISVCGLILTLVGCGGENETTEGEVSSQSTIDGVIDLYVKAIHTEDTDLLLTTIHPFSAQHIELRGYYDNDFAQFDYDVKKVSTNVVEESETSAIVELVFSKTLVEEKGEGKNELAEGEFTQKLTLKTQAEEWVIDKVE